ncbi:MAG: nucleotidyltransferase family protein [Arenicella sp.]|nr:nucleotidyltransferase family protein [Arenicella sp.]
MLYSLARLPLSRHDAVALQSGLQQILDWPDFLEQIEQHGMAPLLLEHVQEHDLDLRKQALLSLKALQMRHILAVDTCFELLRELDMFMEEVDVPYLVLHAMALAPLLYQTIELRPLLDIDLLIAEKDLDKVTKFLPKLYFDLVEPLPAPNKRKGLRMVTATRGELGFPIKLNLYLDAMPAEVPGKLLFAEADLESQTVPSVALHFEALGPEHMLHHLCRRLAGHHPDDVIKLIDILDIVAYAEEYYDEIDWQWMRDEYSHVLNTLRLLHPIVPLSLRLTTLVGNVADESIQGIAEPMIAPSRIVSAGHPLGKRLSLLLNPSDWWLHLRYEVPPGKSLWRVKWFKHPLKVLGWSIKRLFSGRSN